MFTNEVSEATSAAATLTVSIPRSSGAYTFCGTLTDGGAAPLALTAASVTGATSGTLQVGQVALALTAATTTGSTSGSLQVGPVALAVTE